MSRRAVTVLTAEGDTEVDAHDDGDRVWLEADAIHRLTGWEPKPEGLCRGDLCVPVRDPGARHADGRLDLAAVSAALQRPFAVARPSGGPTVVSIGDAAHERAAALAGGRAPQLRLPDLSGTLVEVPALERRKRVLLAWSSW
ncbi:hypothetical protein [Rhabdothermincola salaria]|uniref:hypothetical protein n=1 Tax=Rhabdothermincola salaria TaxID=2903142 RepID=UPI001E52DD61|nr:hypothetical protein [Rhabdothermincola salaria]MCD9622947.1 hypothetical protein [Rhabdothermincola salaria]